MRKRLFKISSLLLLLLLLAACSGGNVENASSENNSNMGQENDGDIQNSDDNSGEQNLNADDHVQNQDDDGTSQIPDDENITKVTDEDGKPPVTTSADGKLSVGFTSSLKKIYLDEFSTIKDILHSQGNISLARREYEALQLVLLPTADINQISVQVSDLVHKDSSSSISSNDIEVNMVGYVNQLEAKVEGDVIGWIPDPLLPDQMLHLKAGVLQPVLITVKTQHNTQSGIYKGNIEVAKEGKMICCIPLTVKVWNFVLPLKPVFKTAHFADWGSPEQMWPGISFTNEQRRKHMEDLAELGFKNHLPPTIFFASGLVSWNWNGEGDTRYGYPTHDGTTFNAKRTDELIDFMLERGANHFFMGITSDIYKVSDKVDFRKQRLIAYLNDYRNHLISRGLLDMTYVYNVDEAWGESASQHARDTYTLIKSNVGTDVKVLQNSNENTSTMFDRFLGYFDAFDINLGFYDINNSDAYRQNNVYAFKDFWWNVNIWPDVHPNLFLEYPLYDTRIIGPMSFRYNMQGFEYWQVISKSSIGNYHPVAPDEFRVKWDVDKKSLDGCLIYPSSDQRIFSSLRYESFRDGMEDQEYLYILQELDPENSLLSVPIITALDTFTNDSSEFLAFRQQLAEAIEKFQ